ncbi:MAG TPA: hypothetical protein VF009_03880 [Solirubrobacterales bacterium]
MKQLRKRLTYANVMSSIAVFLVIGGATAFAALGKNTVGTKQLKKNAVVGSKVKNGSLTGVDIQTSTLGTVPSATNAVHAKTADSASHATSADTAGSATKATTAGNAEQLGGATAGSFQRYGATLPSGQSESGVWGSGIEAAAPGDSWRPTMQFPIPLSAGLDESHTIYVPGPSAAHCPGAGQADSGYLCVYEENNLNANVPESDNIYNPEGFNGPPGTGTHGFSIFLTAETSGPVILQGTWTVTAP